MATMPSAPRALREGEIPPDILAERARLAATDPAPSQEVRSGGALGLMAQRDFLYGRRRGFSNRRLTINQRYEMRADAILAFANFVALVPIISAKRYIRCRNAQKASLIDNALKRMYGPWAAQASEAWNFGYQAQAKEFAFMRPGWQYIDRDDPNGPTAKPTWDYGDIPMLVWAPFVNLRPEVVSPIWDGRGGFAGIGLRGTEQLSFLTETIPDILVSSPGTQRMVPLENSLWIVNQRDAQFGSIWGWPRTAYAYKFWRAYELVLAILEHSAERKGDPLTIVTFPNGSTPWGASQVLTPNQTIATQIAQQAKAGTILVLPSDVYEAEGGKARQWGVEYVKSEDRMDTLVDILKYFDSMKLRAMSLAEQGLIEGAGGSSSRNVAAVFGNRNVETQFLFQNELDATINRYMIPQLSEQNLPWLRDEPAEVVTIPFGDQNEGLLSDLIKSKANSQSNDLQIDWSAALERLGIETLSVEAIADAERKLIEKAAAPDPTPVAPDARGNAGRTDTGFYYEPRPRVELGERLADAFGELVALDDDALLATLPPTQHYQDASVLAQARALRRLWFDLLTSQYEDFASWIERDDEDIHLSNADLAEADPEKRRSSIVDRIVSSWRFNQKVYASVVEKTSKALDKVFSRAGGIELVKAGLSEDDWKPGEEKVADWTSKHTATMVRRIESTTRKQLREFLLSEMRKNHGPKQVAAGVRSHFAEFPAWRADLIAREEVRRTYNAATLFASQANGGKQVQALDARHGPTDQECMNRDGKLFDIGDAFAEDEKEHPGGTLAWRMLPRNATLSFERVVDEEDADWVARVDRERAVVYLRDGVPEAVIGPYLVQVVDYLLASSG